MRLMSVVPHQSHETVTLGQKTRFDISTFAGVEAMISRSFDKAPIGKMHSIEMLRRTPSHGFDGSKNHSSGINVIAGDITGNSGIYNVIDSLRPFICINNRVPKKAVTSLAGEAAERCAFAKSEVVVLEAGFASALQRQRPEFLKPFAQDQVARFARITGDDTHLVGTGNEFLAGITARPPNVGLQHHGNDRTFGTARRHVDKQVR